jgi:hypothetical protein
MLKAAIHVDSYYRLACTIIILFAAYTIEPQYKDYCILPLSALHSVEPLESSTPCIAVHMQRVYSTAAEGGCCACIGISLQ